MANLVFTAGAVAFKMILVDPAEGEQREISVTAGQTLNIDSSIVAVSPDVYAKKDAGKMVLTSGVMPAQDFSAGSPDVPGVAGAAKGALTTEPDATDLPTAIALVNELKGIVDSMNA